MYVWYHLHCVDPLLCSSVFSFLSNYSRWLVLGEAFFDQSALWSQLTGADGVSGSPPGCTEECFFTSNWIM